MGGMMYKNVAYHEGGHVVAWTVLTGNPPHSAWLDAVGGGATQLFPDPHKRVPANM
jgi:hypothetical protein